MKTIILAALILISCGSDTDVPICYVTPLCDSGRDCWRAVEVNFDSDYGEDLTVQGYLPNGVNVCTVQIRGMIATTLETDIEYFYAHGYVHPDSVVYMLIELDDLVLPEAPNGERDFGVWV